MKSFATYLSWILLGVALCAWVGVWYAAGSIRAQAVATASAAQSTDQQSQRLAYQKRISALASDTEDERAKLEGLVKKDVVTIVNTLEAAGTPLGTKLSVKNAQAAGVGEELADGTKLRPVEFLVEGNGSFATLMRVVSVYEHLPLVASLSQVEIGRTVSGTGASDWNLVLRVRVYTTADISP